MLSLNPDDMVEPFTPLEPLKSNIDPIKAKDLDVKVFTNHRNQENVRNKKRRQHEK